MFYNEIFSATQLNTSIKCWLILFIFSVFVRHVRQWNILCNSTQYFNKTLVKMIHFQCVLFSMADNGIFSVTQLNTSIKRWLK